MENRELNMDDYLAMLRRRMKVIFIPLLLAPIAGFLVSYIFSPKYTSRALVLIEAPKIPDTVVQQVFSEDLTQHVATIQQQVLSPTRLHPMIDRLGLAKPGQNTDDLMDNIRLNMSIDPVVTDLSLFRAKKMPAQSSPVPGFFVTYTASTPHDAQMICADLTSMLLEEDSNPEKKQLRAQLCFLPNKSTKPSRTSTIWTRN